MSEIYRRWLMETMVVFAIFIAIGWAVSTIIYRRLGYPIKPSFLKGIRLRDDIETICTKIEGALNEGFHVKELNNEYLRIEKQYADPPCFMTIEFYREFGAIPWSVTYGKVRCRNHAWLNWKWSCGSNAYRLRRKNKH